MSRIVRTSSEKQMPDLMAEDAEFEPGEERAAELRQMLEGKAFRQRERGETPIDVDAELARLLASGNGERP
jgi:hypothetical protein